jgi:hypothetical protein
MMPIHKRGNVEAPARRFRRRRLLALEPAVFCAARL